MFKTWKGRILSLTTQCIVQMIRSNNNIATPQSVHIYIQPYQLQQSTLHQTYPQGVLMAASQIAESQCAISACQRQSAIFAGLVCASLPIELLISTQSLTPVSTDDQSERLFNGVGNWENLLLICNKLLEGIKTDYYKIPNKKEWSND